MENPQGRQWRDEKVFIVFQERRSELRSLENERVGDWVVSPKDKAVSRGQRVVWNAVPGGNIRLYLPPQVFDPDVVQGQDQVFSTIRADAQIGYFLYEAYVNNQLATGGSSPGMIVDP